MNAESSEFMLRVSEGNGGNEVDPRLTEMEIAEFLPESWVDWDTMRPDQPVDLSLDTLAETFKSGRPEVLLSEIHKACPELLATDLPVPATFRISLSYARAEALIDGLGLRQIIEEAERWGHSLGEELELRARKRQVADAHNDYSQPEDGSGPSPAGHALRGLKAIAPPLISLETLESRHDDGSGVHSADSAHLTRRVQPMLPPQGGGNDHGGQHVPSGAGDELYSLFGDDALHRLITPLRPKYLHDDPEATRQVSLKAAFALRKSLDVNHVFNLAIECAGIDVAAYFHGPHLHFHVVASNDLPIDLTEAAMCEAFSLVNTPDDSEAHETEVRMDHGRLVFFHQEGDCLAVWTQAEEFAPGVHEKLLLILQELVSSVVALERNGG